jgi:hypothetical protein
MEIVGLEATSFALMGIIAIGLSVFTYNIEMARQEEDDERNRRATTRASYRARATKALRAELEVSPKSGNTNETLANRH